jgi:alpha-tubulin suppressor-like RCC1 family protein
MTLGRTVGLWGALCLACGGSPPPPAAEAPAPAPERGVRLAAGGAHACRVTDAGRVLCWGANGRGQLGDGTRRTRGRPAFVAGLEDAVEVTAGAAHTCARTRAGAVFCWGAGLRGQLGHGADGEAAQAVLRPVRVEGLADVVQVAAGALHTCALRADGRVACWGDDAAGQLGDGEPAAGRRATPVELELEGVRAIAAGQQHTCAVDARGAVRCWGAGDEGQLGHGRSGPEAGSSFPVEVALDRPVIGVTAGQDHTCAWTGAGGAARSGGEGSGGAAEARPARGDGEVLCWGANDRGQLGRGGAPEDRAATPGPVRQLRGVAAVHAGAQHTCARLASGPVFCWGGNRFGQVGDGTHADAPAPAATGVAAAELAAGETHTCARHRGGAVACWGRNDRGQLGDGRVAWRATPGFVEELRGVGAVAAGGHHTCALRESAAICWGDNALGQLGDLTHVARSAPVPAVFVRGPRQVAAALGRTCVRDAEGVVSCVGYRGDASAPDGADARPRAVALGELGEIVQLAVARDFACALSGEGAIHCWGDNSRGQLGDGTLESRAEPTAVRGAGDAREIAVGVAHACARLLSGAVYCWGANERGQLGDGTNEDRTVPTEVVELADAERLALGRSHSCARRRDGTVACWGGNASGQLGDGTTTARTTPAAVRELSGVEELAAGWLHTCARSGGAVRCWGANTHGQLGRATEAVRASSPASVESLEGAVQITAGGLHTCARTADGRVACWGANTHGQLGGGVTLYAPRPVLVLEPR